jgi:hypothetical protein
MGSLLPLWMSVSRNETAYVRWFSRVVGYGGGMWLAVKLRWAAKAAVMVLRPFGK